MSNMTIDQLNRLDITFDDIQKANGTIATTEIKGKDYASVSERIKVFRMLYPQGFIKTELISNTKEEGNNPFVCIFKATAGFLNADGNEQILGTGYAYEKENSSFINKTSYIENCETSAVGRALGMCGIGIDSDVASYDEVATATVNQEAEKPITALKVKSLTKMCEEDSIPIMYVCDLYGVSELKELNERKFVNIVNNWDKLKTKYAEKGTN